MPLNLKTTCAPNPRSQPLVDGDVVAKDIEFDWNLQPVPMLVRNNSAFDDLELSEMSISDLIRATAWASTMTAGTLMVSLIALPLL